ncbi:MAG TPA: magnesium/cobalt transporter CorA [Polyangiaceae bacterium]|nr:magnesium/cobalt transporter CorA [Polyangiaceae bacterium]
MLINCVLYQEGKKIRDIPMDDDARWTAEDGGFVWVALKDPTAAELDAVQQRFGLHELAVEDARQGHQRPKIEEYDDSLFFVIHLVEMRDGELTVGEVDVFLGPHYVVSVRSRSEHGFLGVRARAEREPEMLRQGATFVAYALLDTVIERYFPVVDALETELERIEGQIFAGGAARSNIVRLYRLKQQVGELRHAVAPLMEALGKLLGGRAPALCLPSQHYFRNAYDHLSRINAATDSIRDMIGTAIQVNLSMVTIEEGEVTKRLAAWAAIVAVVPALAGIWGMNFKYMPDLEWAYGYPLAIGLMVVVCGALYSRFRAAKWI